MKLHQKVEMNENFNFFYSFYSQKATRAMKKHEGTFSIVNEAWCVSFMCKRLNDTGLIHL